MGAMAKPATVSRTALDKLVSAATPLGVDGEELTRAALADAPEGGRDRITVASLARAWDSAIRQTGRHDLPLLSTAQYAPSDYTVLGYVCSSSPTLGDCLEQLARYIRIWIDGASWEPVGGDPLILRYRLTGDPLVPGIRYISETALAEVVQATRLLTGQHIAPLAVHQDFDPSPERAAFEEFFGCEVVPNAGQNALWISRELLEIPLPNPNPKVRAYLEERARTTLEKRGQLDTPIGQIREAMAEALRAGQADVRGVSKRAAMSTRTLRRRLEEAGTNFRRLLDETRSDLARAYVEDESMRFGDIAFALGFGDKAAFFRAFRRWTGLTPLKYRTNALERPLAASQAPPPQSSEAP